MSPASDLEARIAAQDTRVADLEAALAAVHEASRTSNADDEHDPEGATIAFERQQLVATLATARRTAEELSAARARLVSGEPVTCRGCGRPVPAARLAARPQADTCIDCAR